MKKIPQFIKVSLDEVLIYKALLMNDNKKKN